MRTGRPTDPKKVTLTTTRGSMTKNANTANAKAAAALATPPNTPTARPHDGKGRDLVGSPRNRSPFLNAVRKWGNLAAAEKKAIEDVWGSGMSLADCTAAWMHNWLHAQKAYKDGHLTPAIYQAALNQLMTSACKLAELSERKGESLPNEVRICLDLSATKAGRESAPAPGPCGDKLEVE